MLEYLEHKKNITNLSNYKTPAYAQYFFELKNPKDINKVYEIYAWAKDKNLPILFISGGTNLLFAFDEYKGVVIKNSLQGWTYGTETSLLTSYGTESIWDIAQSLENDYGQDIWHRFIGLPGSIAGAIYGNAGCFGLETENNFLECEVLNLDTGERLILRKDDMEFSYRNSIIKKEKKFFIIHASFDLSKVVEKYSSTVDNIDFRENKQPKGNSCGSFFKNPNREQSAGYLIEQVGLKGFQIGGAYFSEKHANFLMHDGSGTYKDMLELIQLAQEKVKSEFGIELENEVQIIHN